MNFVSYFMGPISMTAEKLIGLPATVSVALALVVAGLVLIHFYYKNAFTYWQKKGLPHPPPRDIFGNMIEFMFKENAALTWMASYGKVYGIYQGSKPVLCVLDPNIMRRICIQDFDKFPNHLYHELSPDIQKNFIFMQRNARWRTSRSILSPTFTSGKMRRMFKLLDVCANDLVKAFGGRLDKKNDLDSQIINLKDLFGLYTMDAIASCCFAFKMMSYTGEENLKSVASRDQFVREALKILDFPLWRLVILFSINEKILTKLPFNIAENTYMDDFAKRVELIIARRKSDNASNKYYDDYLQILLDANANYQPGSNNVFGDHILNDKMDMSERHHVGSEGEYLTPGGEKSGSSCPDEIKSRQRMTDIETLANASLMLVVGLETTAILLTNCVYALSFHQEIQEKLYNAIVEIAKKEDGDNSSSPKMSFDYESITSCKYLDAVISESLRTTPPIAHIDRVASEDYYLESHGVHLTKGTTVLMMVREIMKDPESWPNPLVFDPERFMPENKDKIIPGSYCPFGLGPRHCLGMRFSLTEAKIALAKLLLEFRFEPVLGMSYPPKMSKKFGFNPIERPEVRFSKREKSF